MNDTKDPTSSTPADRLPVVICGPQGCGKTRHGTALARHFGRSVIVDADGLAPGEPVPADSLVLTHSPDAAAEFGGRVYAFDQAMELAGLRN